MEDFIDNFNLFEGYNLHKASIMTDLKNFVNNSINIVLQNISFKFNNSSTRAKVENGVKQIFITLSNEGKINTFGVYCDERNNPPHIIESNNIVVSGYYKDKVGKYFYFNKAYTPLFTNEIEQLIRDINWQVWYYNEYYSDPSIVHNSELYKNIGESAVLIKGYAQMISNNFDCKKVIDECTNNIEKICYGSEYTEKESRLREMPKYVADIIIEKATKLIDLQKSNKDDGLQSLKKKYCNKYLYFEGYESGSVIINMKDIYYLEDELVWKGKLIDLHTENSSCGPGVIINNVEKQFFDELPYYENDYDFEDKLYNNDVIGYLDCWLSYNEYGNHVNGNKNSREITSEQLYSEIDRKLKYYIDEKI